jgi:tetratricopeptide (TPR) repeat protein
MAAGDAGGAELAFLNALRIAPDLAEAHANLGILLENRGALDDAESRYRLSIDLNPDYSQTHSNLGNLLASRKRFAEAEAALRRAVAIAPASPAAWSNLGVLLACLKREDEAERCYRTAISVDPGHANARFNLAYLLLRQGKFGEGWACLEARPWARDLAAKIDCPRWQGEPLAGKSLLVWYEAGYGDMIQFCRYLPVLKAQGASRITLACHPALQPLLATLADVDAVFAATDDIPVQGHDYWTYPLSIPHHCRTEIDSIPAAIPYLHVAQDRIGRWAKHIPADGFRVGLVWKGGSGHENDADRSLPTLKLLTPLGTVSGVQFISLQKGAGEDEARSPPPDLPLVHLGSDIADFADTAAIVTQLDLVICVDTAVAHLAGALGRPCWVLLPDYKTDWRWLTTGADSPWYPQRMRLFRQRRAGDWAPVVEEIRTALVAQRQ